MHTIQLRNIPEAIYEGLKASAKASKRSMTQEAIVALDQFLAKSETKADFESQRKQIILDKIKQLHMVAPLKAIPEAWFDEDLK